MLQNAQGARTGCSGLVRSSKQPSWLQQQQQQQHSPSSSTRPLARRCHATAATSVAAEPKAAAEAAAEPAPQPVHASLPAPAPARFELNNTVFVEEFRIRGNEAGPDQRANIITIANLLQEVGGNHGVAMWGRSSSGFASMPGMDHLIFVATRMQIRMEAYPMWGDTVRLQTYFAEDGRLTSRRDWRITDANTGKHLGAATSTWVTINTETRKPAKIPAEVKQRFRQLAHDGHTIPTKETRRKLPEFVWPAQLTAPSQLGRRSDMDPNGHINNVAYLAWAMEVIPQATYEGYQLTEVEMDFKAECTAGDVIECFGMPLVGEERNSSSSSASSSDQQFLHLLRKGDTDTEVWRARTTWAPVGASSSSSSSSTALPSSSSSSSNGVVAPVAASNGSKPAPAAAAAASNGKAPAAAPSSSDSSSSDVAAEDGEDSSSSRGCVIC